MIEESGDNWYYIPPDMVPTVQVIATVSSVERTETIEKPGKKRKKAKKPRTFGFAQALDPKDGARGSKT